MCSRCRRSGFLLDAESSGHLPRGVRTYQLAPEALTPAADWIGRQRLPAEHRLDRLGELLNRPSTTTKEGTT